jgi:hypothetical protein
MGCVLQQETATLKKGTKKSGNMSQIIRDYAAQNPTMGPTQIAKDLEAQGHKAYPALVSQALRNSKTKKTAKRGRKPGSVKKVTGELSLEHLKASGDFIRLHGSLETAVEALKTYQKVSSLFG